MEPLEFEVRRDLECWDTTEAWRPAGPEQVLVTAPAADPGAPPPGRRPGVLAPVRMGYPAGAPPQRGPTPRGPAPGGTGNPLSMVARMLSVADYEAAAITQQASYQAAMITRQVAYEAAEIREAAKREADHIRQQAAAQAAGVREAAERDAAEVRAAVMSMQNELGEFAARITDTFPSLPRIRPIELPAVPPPAIPPTRPGARPPMAPAARPAARPGPRPAKKPRPASRPASGQGRQGVAMRFAAIATSALFLVAVVAGAIEIHLHGFDFFIFRSAGTGETGPNGLKEDQGPGQPDAPKPTPSHVKVEPSPHRTVTTHKAK
jgi:hypothetical protein